MEQSTKHSVSDSTTLNAAKAINMPLREAETQRLNLAGSFSFFVSKHFGIRDSLPIAILMFGTISDY